MKTFMKTPKQKLAARREAAVTVEAFRRVMAALGPFDAKTARRVLMTAGVLLPEGGR